MKRAQAQAPGRSSVERLGWEEELIKETEKELPVRKEGHQDSAVPRKPGEGCCDERALSHAAYVCRNKIGK